MNTIDLYFDFISPYSYLAWRLVPTYVRIQGQSLRLFPVSAGLIFSELGVRAPGEIENRRFYALSDLSQLAEYYGLPFRPPPRHPFNPIYALRSVLLVDDPVQQHQLVDAYFDHAWAQGRSLENLDELRQILHRLHIDQDPEHAACSPEARRGLKHNSRTLIEIGGFGVPTFVHAGRLYFGHDRLMLLDHQLASSIPKFLAPGGRNR